MNSSTGSDDLVLTINTERKKNKKRKRRGTKKTLSTVRFGQTTHDDKIRGVPIVYLFLLEHSMRSQISASVDNNQLPTRFS